jgi:hypothetical protein
VLREFMGKKELALTPLNVLLIAEITIEITATIRSENR